MGSLVDLATRLFPFDYSVTGPGNDAAACVLRESLPFAVCEYASGRELNGWTIPPACMVEKAQIRRNGRVLIDCAARPLGVPAQSDTFTGRLSLEELQRHLFSVPSQEQATPYHWMRLYRPQDPVWGFCISQRELDSLTAGTYDVELVTHKSPATMKVFVHELRGDTAETILINAHNCHPFQANDDLSGVVVGIELLRRLEKLPTRRFTYLLMVAPELFGPMFWLDEQSAAQVARIKCAVMLKSVGNERPLRLQQSFHGTARVDLAAHNVFRSRYGTYDSGEFRAIYGNDETVFEAPPFAIPSISLTRWPFPEYHTDLDTPERLSEERLQDTVAVAFEICQALEMDVRLTTTSRGLVCLSGHGLYKPVPLVEAGGVDYSSAAGRWNRLMNALPRLMDGKSGLLDVAERFRLPIGEVYAYALQWIRAGLAAHVDLPGEPDEPTRPGR